MPFFFLPTGKPENCAIGTHYGQYGELVPGPHLADDGIIYEDASDLDNKEDE